MKWVHSDVWESISENDSPTQQFAQFENLIHEKVNFWLPEKRIKMSKKDKEFITAELKTLDKNKKTGMVQKWEKPKIHGFKN